MIPTLELDKKLTQIDANLFELRIKFASIIGHRPCTLFYDKNVSRETYIDRCLCWLNSEAENKTIILGQFPGDEILAIVARVCYEANTRCTPVRESADFVKLIFG